MTYQCLVQLRLKDGRSLAPARRPYNVVYRFYSFLLLNCSAMYEWPRLGNKVD